MLQAAPREPVVKHVHRELRSAILQGRIVAGARLVETLLAERLKVSRTPVREAIQKLESEGLVRRLRHGGVVVEDARSHHFEIILVRQSIEAAAARLACIRGSVDELRALKARSERALEEMPRLARDDRAAVDRDFHASLAKAAGSARLAALVEEYYEYSWGEPWRERAGEVDDDSAIRFQRQHVAIAHALCGRDADAAERAVREHLELVRRTLGLRGIEDVGELETC